MARIRGLLLFYRSFFLIPGLILTICGCYLYYRNAKYEFGMGPYVVALKFIVFALAAYSAYRSKELYYYYNLRLSYVKLVVTAFMLDFLLFFSYFKIASYFY
jgi:hypothetical protein